MHATPAGDPRESRGEEIVGTAHIAEGADVDGNDRRTRVIWAAGFFDGEGSIGIYKTRRGTSFQLSIAANQVDPSPLEILVWLFGGNVYNSTARNRPLKSWRLGSRKAAAALQEMHPYLVNKKAQAKVALQFQDSLVLGNRGPGSWGNRPLTEVELEGQRQASEELKRLKRL